MFRSKHMLLVVSLLAVLSMVISACAPAATPTAVPAAPATKAPAAPATAVPAAPATKAPAAPEPTKAPEATKAPESPKSKDPATFTEMTFGDPETLDPAVDYETAGSGILLNVYEGLITFDGPDPLKFKPALAKEIPEPKSLDNGAVQYVWHIVDNAKFHSGDPVTAEDVAFSFQRNMLVGDPNTPAFLMSEAFFDIDDATQLVDPDGALVGDPEGLKKADAKKLVAACQTVKDAVQFDNATGTVTTTLVHGWGPLMPTLAGGGWAFVYSKKWTAENKDWDGDCKTWQNFYGIPSESGVLRDKTNGSGPYKLDHWTPGEEIVLVANDAYRNGVPNIKRVVIKNVTEFGTRFAAVQAGDSDNIQVGSQADWAQLDTIVRDECDIKTGECKPADPANPAGILRRYKNRPAVNRTDVFFNFNVAEGGTLIGTAALDGQGIPATFFADVHVRRAFNYCFDWETYIKDVQLGDGEQSLALTLPGQPGYDGTPAYKFDLAKCEEEFKASELKDEAGKTLWDLGFYLQVAYNAGNTQRQAIAEILANGLQQVNPNFFIAPVAMPWPAFLRMQRAKQLPLFVSGWQEDIHDPHNWYVPYLTGTYGQRQSLPKDLTDKYKPLIAQGVLETDQAKRAEIYGQLNKMIYEDAPDIILAFSLNRRYEPLWLHGWFGGKTQNEMVGGQGPFFGDFTKD